MASKKETFAYQIDVLRETYMYIYIRHNSDSTAIFKVLPSDSGCWLTWGRILVHSPVDRWTLCRGRSGSWRSNSAHTCSSFLDPVPSKFCHISVFCTV